MAQTAVVWMFLVGAPCAGMLAIAALAVFHEYFDRSAAPRGDGGRGLARPPQVARRSPADLLATYLEDDRQATYAARRARQAGQLDGTVRASTAVLDEYLAERVKPVTVPAPRPRTPERAPRPTRLVALSA